MINKIIKDWVGEEIQKLEYPEGTDYVAVKALQDLITRIPQLTERIKKETQGEQTIVNLFKGKKIIKSKMLPKDEIWVGEGPTRSGILKTKPDINNTLKGGKE